MNEKRKCSKKQFENIEDVEKKSSKDGNLNSEKANNVDNFENCENSENAQSENESEKTVVITEAELKKLKTELEEKSRDCQEYLDRFMRTAAEYDNYRKRTSREKESFYAEVLAEVVGAFLPVLDNIERAVQSADNCDDVKALKEGIELVLRQMKDTMEKLGIEYIECVGQKFDPQYQEAVMHIEDDSYEENVVVEEFKKGYKYKDKVIRYSMVKVAN